MVGVPKGAEILKVIAAKIHHVLNLETPDSEPDWLKVRRWVVLFKTRMPVGGGGWGVPFFVKGAYWKKPLTGV